MKQGTKVTLLSLAIAVGLGIVMEGGFNAVLSHIAQRRVNKVLATIPDAEASVGSIQVGLLTGTAVVKDVKFAYNGERLAVSGERKPGTEVSIERIEVGRVFFFKLFDHEALVHSVNVIRPKVELWMDEDHPELCMPAFELDTSLLKLLHPLKKAELMNLDIEEASFALHSTRSALDVAVNDFTLSMQEIVYDSTFHICDTMYLLSVGHAAILTPDSLLAVEMNGLAHANQGPLTIGATRVRHTVGRMQLGDIVHEPTTWIDMQMEQLRTSPLNPIRKAFAKDYSLDKVEVVFGKMDLVRDLRYKPKKPFIMVQQAFKDIQTRFLVDHVDALIKHIHIDLTSTDINCGQLDMHEVRAVADHVTNYRYEVTHLKGSCPVGGGTIDISMDFTANKNCDFETRLHAEHVNGAFLNPLLRPLVGMTCAMQIDTLDSRYAGNKVSASGTFRMLYHGLKAKVHKEDDIPYKIVTRHAGAINVAANTLLPKSNPTKPHHKPKAYNISWKRNEWAPTELYLFGPCIDGVVKTMLPGLFIKDKNKTVEW